MKPLSLGDNVKGSALGFVELSAKLDALSVEDQATMRLSLKCLGHKAGSLGREGAIRTLKLLDKG